MNGFHTVAKIDIDWVWSTVLASLTVGLLTGCASTGAAPGAMASAAPVAPLRAPSSLPAAGPVTGSLLPRATMGDALPLTVIDAEAERQQGITTAAGLINGTPSNR